MSTCELCRAVSRDVSPWMAWYADPDATGRVKVIDRCEDEAACRERVEAAGDEWPLLTREAARRALA
jgi:hypothetical protein